MRFAGVVVAVCASAGLLVGCSSGQDSSTSEPAPPPLPAPALLADWHPSPDFPSDWMVCWDQSDPSNPGTSTWVGSPSQIPQGATNIRNIATCNPPHLNDPS